MSGAGVACPDVLYNTGNKTTDFGSFLQKLAKVPAKASRPKLSSDSWDCNGAHQSNEPIMATGIVTSKT